MPCHVDAVEKPVDEHALRGAAVVLLKLRGMGCGNCLNRVRNALLRLPAVVAAEVTMNGRGGHARVHFDASRAGLPDLLDAVAGAGEGTGHTYAATGIEVPAD